MSVPNGASGSSRSSGVVDGLLATAALVIDESASVVDEVPGVDAGELTAIAVGAGAEAGSSPALPHDEKTHSAPKPTMQANRRHIIVTSTP